MYDSGTECWLKHGYENVPVSLLAGKKTDQIMNTWSVCIFINELLNLAVDIPLLEVIGYAANELTSE